jgi:hypothetical protein
MAKEPKSDVDVETLAETENYMAWISEEPDGEHVVHLELGSVTVHFFREEWSELLNLIDQARKNSPR